MKLRFLLHLCKKEVQNEKDAVCTNEQICALIKQRKEISNNNPGFPPFESISKWAENYELYEDFLKAVFGTLLSEEHFKPMVEPIDFRKHIAVLKSIEKDELFYTLTSIRHTVMLVWSPLI